MDEKQYDILHYTILGTDIRFIFIVLLLPTCIQNNIRYMGVQF
jgi:hypothetical protein